MLIKKMAIENFRQYVGKQEIIFSTDKEKNVTLFLGDNGAGKTVISQAFIWCFYGETPAFTKKESLLSKSVEKEMRDGFERAVNVTITMTHSKREYEVSRTSRYVMKNGMVDMASSVLSISETVNGEKKFLNGRALENCVNEILPKELSQYFFLSGEKIDSMSNDIKVGKPKDFANAVNTLLDLDYYKNAIKHLKSISKEYDVSNVAGLEEELQGLNNEIALKEKDLECSRVKKDNLDKSIADFEEQIIEKQSRLKSIQSAKDIQLQIEKKEEQLKRSEERLNSIYEFGIKSFVQKAPYAFLSKSAGEMNAVLDDLTRLKSEDIPERLHADLLDWIEKRGICICGNKIQRQSETFKALERWRRVVPPESIGILARQMSEKADDKIARGQGLKDDLQNDKSQIDSQSEIIETLNEELEPLKEKLDSAEDTSAIQRSLNNDRAEKEKAQGLRDECVARIGQLQVDLERAKRERKEIISSTEEGKKVIAWKNMTERLLEMFERKVKSDEDEKRTLLTQKVKQAFKNIYGESFSIEIDENYRISTNTDLEKSTGQGMAVIFSFLAGLLDVIKSDKKKAQGEEDSHIELESYPLVLDAPFSALDKQRIKSICSVLPKVSEQIIIFIKDTDGNIAKEEMKGKIGNSYVLKKRGKDDMETIVEEENV